MAAVDELRLVARVASLYFVDGMKQADIAARLHISQAGISRLLQRARDAGIVRITVAPPQGTFPDTEEELCMRFGLSDAIVADCDAEEDAHILTRIGAAAALYVETTLRDGDVVGVAPWSEPLVRMVQSMHPVRRASARAVVPLLHDSGNARMQARAEQLVARLARLTHATPAPLTDCPTEATRGRFSEVTMALVGIGALGRSDALRDGDVVLDEGRREELEHLEAVGGICLNFFDANGAACAWSFGASMSGITLAELRGVPRVIAVAGGRHKWRAIRAALRGRLIDVLITDRFTGRVLLDAG
jgi:DNA-binding transcriptional regulator LsrR (DeoR family)